MLTRITIIKIETNNVRFNGHQTFRFAIFKLFIRSALEWFCRPRKKTSRKQLKRAIQLASLIMQIYSTLFLLQTVS